MENLPVVILAGGMGTRLKDVIHDVPKPMAPIGGKPFLEYLVRQLVRWGLRDIILSVGFKRDVIKDYFDNGERWGVSIRYVEEDTPQGTGGAIRDAARLIAADSFIVLNGDSYFDVDFSAFHRFHRDKHAELSLAMVMINDTGRYGRVDIESDCRVARFQEKQDKTSGYINSGIYLLNTTVLSRLPAEGPSSFEKDLLMYCHEICMYGMPHSGFFVDIGVPDDYLFICNNIGLLL
jgi:D-glycero-alpha-D-manno-heptose 1-phosphate guanylyltransferase